MNIIEITNIFNELNPICSRAVRDESEPLGYSITGKEEDASFVVKEDCYSISLTYPNKPNEWFVVEKIIPTGIMGRWFNRNSLSWRNALHDQANKPPTFESWENVIGSETIHIRKFEKGTHTGLGGIPFASVNDFKNKKSTAI